MEERKTTLPSENEMLEEVKLDACVNDGLPLLSDEKFDFNLSLSPASEHEDEVFVGPMSHKEKCIAVSLEAVEAAAEEKALLAVGDALTWSPLAGEKFVEIFKEAHLVALQLQSASKAKKEAPRRLGEPTAEIVETFVQQSMLKIFENGIDSEKTPRALKRETYCVWESPLSQLPPSLQKQLHPLEAVTDSLRSPQTPVNASSPFGMGKLTKVAVVSATRGHSDKKGPKASQLQPVTTLASRNGRPTAVEQAKPGRLPSPSCRNRLNSAGSSEDLLSDKLRIASQVRDLSFCSGSSVRANRTLSTPSKMGMKMTQLKLPSNVHMRRDTLSASSSSLSSMNSSLNSSRSISPNRGKAASVGPKASTNSSWLSSGPSKISVVRPMRVSSVQASHSDASDKQPASAPKGGSSVPKCKPTLSAKISEPSFQKSLQKSILDNRRSSTPTAKTPLGLSAVKKPGSSSENAATKVLQPIGLQSSGNTVSNVAFSPPIKQSDDETVSKSCLLVQPTRIGRRFSGIPVTPKTLPRLLSTTDALPIRRVSSVSSKKSLQTCSKWTKEKKIRFTSSSSSSAEGESFWPQVVPVALDFSPEKTPLEKEQDLTVDRKPTEETKPAEHTPVKEGLLIDIEINKMPAVTQECEGKPLIDFFNTPEMKPLPLKPTGQLIDLSSPLIHLSPEGNKENLDSPLLKF